MPESLSLVPPTKRKRTDGNEEPDSSITRSQFWFEDGSIVIEAEQTQFCVHRTILTGHSKFFGDMFSVPQPDGEVLVEGCHVVRVSDTAEDWENFLTVIYQGQRLYKSVNQYPLKTLISILRLGNKYEFIELRNHALERIKLELPRTLKGWDQTYETCPHEANYANIISDNEFDLVNIAEELQIRSILPAAYFLCLYDQSLDTIFNGIVREDGTTSQLSHSTLHVILQGRDTIFRAMIDTTFGWLMKRKIIPCNKCTDTKKCRDARVKQHEVFQHELLKDIGLALKPWDDDDDIVCDFCKKCLKAAENAFEEGRQAIWDNLPKYFGMPEWDNLHDFEI
ncbi:hypothetical protein GALMADRAFT_254733 [Galerina marginata CBS 339.88]|uniref:BTB domain-containing protein n=1 Tax=Galerina marginata (strain CBS 339.88) TaxID=685588 RepID=A0A067SV86_GALM3|nr:hypothetical protein GALMADRAFT_254733 [Galerina marginata CBS 339.88]